MPLQNIWRWKMKRRRTGILLVLYFVVFAVTLILEQLSISNPGMRFTVNGLTLLLLVISIGLYWVLRNNVNQKDSRKEIESGKDEIYDKQKYIEFAMSYELTKRETEIGWYMLNGCTNMQISESLYIAETTVKKHVTHIYEKMGISGRKEFRQRFCEKCNSSGKK